MGCFTDSFYQLFCCMNKFFEFFGGPIAVLLSIAATILVSRAWRTDRHNTRGFPVSVLYWGPLFLAACMLLHLIQNAYRAIVSYQENGVFNFYYYSLQLFGIVVSYQAYRLLLQCRLHVNGDKPLNRQLLLSASLIILTTLPTFAFTPIGIIPSIVMTITILISFTTHRKTNHFTASPQRDRPAAIEIPA